MFVVVVSWAPQTSPEFSAPRRQRTVAMIESVRKETQVPNCQVNFFHVFPQFLTADMKSLRMGKYH